jgi:fucose 4-O-acetylase-like acetyltransferase
MRERLADIDRARGLAIILVVAGHLISDDFPLGNDWYVHLNLILYKFHMAFFMFITGFVMFHTLPEMQTLHDYGTYAKKKFVRLMPAYFAFALVMAAGKTVLSRYTQVENPMSGLGDIFRTIWCPADSFCRNLWFIYVIFIYYLLLPPFLMLFRQKLLPLLAVALAVHFLPECSYFCLRQVCQYMFVFVLGGYAYRHRQAYANLIDRYRWGFFAAFAACIGLYFVIDVPKFLFGLVAIPALHSLVRAHVFEGRPLLAWVGKYTFPIYLFNSLIIGGLLTVLSQSWYLDPVNFRMAAPVLFVCGLLVPVALYELFIKRVPILRSIVRA